MSVTEDSHVLQTLADDLAQSRKLDLKVIELADRVTALEKPGAAETTQPAAADAQAWGQLAIRVVRVFLFTAVSTFTTLITGLGSFPDMSTAKSVAWSGVVAAMSAVAKVVQAAFTAGEAPFYGRGVGMKPPE